MRRKTIQSNGTTQNLPSEPEAGRIQEQFLTPAAIEAESLRRIRMELSKMDIMRPEKEMQVICRVIHTTADFDFVKTMFFSGDAVQAGQDALRSGKSIVTDTRMALAGISSLSCLKHGNAAYCFTAEPEICEKAKQDKTTRSYAAMQYAAEHFSDAVYAIGNAPTALMSLEERLETPAFSPSLVIAVPVGFVNVTEAKERILKACERRHIPVIVSRGRKGGSPVAAAIVNALFYGMTAQQL